MDYNEQTDALVMELDNLISRFGDEFDINNYTMIGVLEAKKMELLLDNDVEFLGDPDLLDEDPEDGFEL
tara:strand:+ start:199 stop:405 length:207 start_codon:yes stop_codon:yes gene_type:complete